MGDGFAVLGGRSVAEHTDEVQRQIRARPQDASLRLALCHFLAVRGEWQRADDQRQRAMQLDPNFTPAASTYAMALAGERHRSEFWAGGRPPAIPAGQAEWVDQLISAAALPTDQALQAAALRDSARQAAPAVGGALQLVDRSDTRPDQTVDDEPVERVDFAWLCDGDARIGAVLELFTPSGYAWLPLPAVLRVKLPRPRHLADLIWIAAEIELRDGRALNGLVPVRYPSALQALDDAAALGRRTDWDALPGDDQYAGVGQRILTSDAGDHAFLDIRTIEFETAERAPA
ncbi:MAG: virulence protein SciE type [Variovorax sp.]|nr:MAG: virulence protein SciE type [Variovorax sp.]